MAPAEWLVYVQQHPFLGLRTLGLFNMINMALTLPLYMALYRAHRASAPVLASLAWGCFLLGAAVYTANNRALAMLTLGGQYTVAAGAQKAALEAAAAALLAQAEDFTPGAFPGFFLSSTASLLVMAAMLRGKVFHKGLAWMGMVGTLTLLGFTASVTFAPRSFDAAMPFAMLGGLVMLGWNILVAVRLLRLGSVFPVGLRASLKASLP
jgi:hypothetical protein